MLNLISLNIKHTYTNGSACFFVLNLSYVDFRYFTNYTKVSSQLFFNIIKIIKFENILYSTCPIFPGKALLHITLCL